MTQDQAHWSKGLTQHIGYQLLSWSFCVVTGGDGFLSAAGVVVVVGEPYETNDNKF